MRTVLITGAAGGIGQALCVAFKEAGYRVIGTDRVPISAPCDVALRFDAKALCSDSVERDAFFAAVRDSHSGNGLNALVNNGAIQLLNHTEAITVGEWEETLRTNLLAPFILVQQLLPDLEQAGGSVVNIASIHAEVTKPGFVCYATSKTALVGLTRALSVDLGPRVRVNAILPAAIGTPMLLAGFEGRKPAFDELGNMHPLRRIGTPAEVASIAVFLASEHAGFVTGAAWNVDGGIGGRLHDPA